MKHREAVQYEKKRLVAIDLAKPVPGRRIELSWRQGCTGPQAIGAVSDAVQALKIPGPNHGVLEKR
jgi:hypothetical protein